MEIIPMMDKAILTQNISISQIWSDALHNTRFEQLKGGYLVGCPSMENWHLAQNRDW